VEHVITQEVSFLNPKYGGDGTSARRPFVAEMVEKLARIPGVEAAGATSHLPLTGEEWVSGLLDTDHPERAVGFDALANFRFVTPDYWRTMGIPLLQGRYLEASDQNQPKAAISDRTARYLWPGENPIGKHVRGAGPSKPALEVVGVVGEVRTAGLEKTPPMMVYEHYWRMQPIGMSFVLRTAGDPASAARDIRAILSKADPEMALARPETMAQIVDQSVASRKLQTGLAVAFAVAALLVAALGIYGVISFTVARRTPEMGIRIALGAGRGQLMRMVLRQGMRPVLLGLAAGLGGALGLGRFVAGQLYGVTPHDPWTMAAVAGVLLAVAAGACWIPARRSTRIDPLGALRME
jgi:putative ABC transport system permease protein